MQIRINKYISDSGYCSRREADKYIEQGEVTIDGKRAEVGSVVLPGQVVRIFGEEIRRTSKSVIIAYNKPVGVVSTTDADEKNNITAAIGHDERIFPIGRLDKDSEGLILLTNEGDIVNKILRADNNHDKEYLVSVNKLITADFIQQMQKGVPILGVVTRKCVVTQKGPNTFTIVLRQGLNRQIRRMCEHLGYTVVKLQRIRIMHIHLGDLKPGRHRNLTAAETEELYKKISTSTKTQKGISTRKKPQASPAQKKETPPPASKRHTSRGMGKQPSTGKPKTGKPTERNTSFRPRSKRS
ncbi:23S rRNA pseudouridine(2604) synthase RluF [Parabacteroides sp. OttesenSCG-928-G06]|nr:23S rRNA pseudouridine(2604) synthase RluF [Parabacteroides sp. OttesenSCG-928-K15]MDL2282111.1 23S rRNA pseudouridine(2604) synthase RluF [Parabacteroides sp. OttesenSCG-928-G06]